MDRINNYGQEVSDCYYIDNSIDKKSIDGEKVSIDYYGLAGDEKSKEQLKSKNMIELLNANEAEPAWKQDTNNINNGYPILSWQQ